MKLSKINNRIKLEFQYDPLVVSAVKSIPGACFYKDPLETYWTIPVKSLRAAVKILSLTPGHLYPDLAQYIPKFSGVTAEIKNDRVKLQGANLDLLIKSLDSLCEVEYQSQREIVTQVLGKLIYHKKQYRSIQVPSRAQAENNRFSHSAGISFLENIFRNHPQGNTIFFPL